MLQHNIELVEPKVSPHRRATATGAHLDRSSKMLVGILLAVAVAIPTFLWAYKRHLDILTGPWIMGNTNDQP
jgi:hypothetical protein